MRIHDSHYTPKIQYPWVPVNVMHDWKDDKTVVIPKTYHNTKLLSRLAYSTVLKAFEGAPSWTIEELNTFSSVFAQYGILTSKLKNPKCLQYKKK